MENYRNILVAIDPFMEEQPALHRAVKLASIGTDVHLKFFLPIFDFSYEITSIFSISEREEMREQVIEQRIEWLTKLLEHYPLSLQQYEIKVVWHYRPFEAIIQEVAEHQHDLVIKNTHQHTLLQKFIFTPTDWHLMRESPCPVLLVKDHQWPQGGNILAAIHCGHHDPSHQILNQQIVQSASDLAHSLNARVHLVNAYPTLPPYIMTEIPQFEPQQYSADVRDMHLNAMRQIAGHFQLPDSQTHVTEGLPEEVLPELAHELDAELVILGSQGRTGLGASLLGNTAEFVVDRLDCDLLVLQLPPDE